MPVTADELPRISPTLPRRQLQNSKFFHNLIANSSSACTFTWKYDDFGKPLQTPSVGLKKQIYQKKFSTMSSFLGTKWLIQTSTTSSKIKWTRLHVYSVMSQKLLLTDGKLLLICYSQQIYQMTIYSGLYRILLMIKTF